MARHVAGRLLISGTLIADTPWHVGGAEEDIATDLPLARNGRGRYYLPGSSLAGALRSWLADAFWPERERLERLWGFQEDDRGHASYWIVEDVELTEEVLSLAEIREGVGINRVLGTAHEGILYDRAIVPRGTECPLELVVEVAAQGDWPAVEALCGHLISAWTAGDLRLGAGKSRGLGRVRLGGAAVRRQALDSRDGILAVLAAIRPSDETTPQSGETVTLEQMILARPELQPRPRPQLSIELAWTPLSPVMVKAGFEGLVADAMPLTGRDAGLIAPVIPGSSIKGALRARAEQIVRTVLRLPATTRDPGRDAFLDMIEVPLVTALFGERGKSEELEPGAGDRDDRADAFARPRRGLAAVAVDDVYAEHAISPQPWAAILRESNDRRLLAKLNRAGLHDWTPAYHVAVDRWTGGPAHGALFAVMEPWNLAWEKIRLTVNVRRLTPEQSWPALCLLLLTLRDLASRGPSLPLGFGTNRGMGDVHVDRVDFRGRDLDGLLSRLNGASLSPLAELSLTGEEMAELRLPDNLRAGMADEWQYWILEQPEQLARS